MNLVKNSKVISISKNPRPSTNIEHTFRKGLEKAKKNNWTKVIIIGCPDDTSAFGTISNDYVSSRMKRMTAIGLLEFAKSDMLSGD